MQPDSLNLTIAPKRQALTDLRVGESGAIVQIDLRGRTRRRLLEMGLVAGERVRVERIAPLGDPVALWVKGYQLALRKADAGRIWVTDVD